MVRTVQAECEEECKVKVIGYVRRSKASDNKVVSLLEQADQISRYASANGMQVVEYIEHDGVSGASRGRWEQIHGAIKRHQAGALVFYNQDRLSRDVVGLLENLQQLALAGVEIHEVGQGRVDLADPTKKLATGMRGLFDEFFRDMVKKKTSDALQYKKRRGQRWCHHAPFGYRFDEGCLQPDPDEQQVLRKLGHYVDAGYGSDKAIQLLKQQGYKGRMSRMTIYRSMKRIKEQRQHDEKQEES